MVFFPLINSNLFKGYTTIHNFPPNNWEKITYPTNKSIWAIFSDGIKWETKYLGIIKKRESKTIFYDEVIKTNQKDFHPLILLQLRESNLERKLDYLPSHEYQYTKTPEWRATVGLKIGLTETSYQGEINPFPSKASLLTFHPFIQLKKIDNYFVFINLEAYPSFREEEIEIYDAKTKIHIDRIKVKSNYVNIFPLDKYKFTSEKLPVIICRKMAGIPFGLGISKDQKMVSFEHTHPPASLTIHGDRFKIQNKIKSEWFKILKNDN
jgi:hypothetical protein